MKLHETRQIGRPVSEVFAYTADFSNIENWDPGVTTSKQSTDGAVGIGTKYELMVNFGSRELPMTYEITEYEPNTRVVLVGKGATLEAVDVIEFQDMDGGTFVDYTADLTFHNWIKYVAPLMSPVMKRVGEKALDGLVEALAL